MPKLNVLKGKLVEKGKTYAECADALIVSVTTFSDKMNGKSKFSVEEANTLSNYIGLTGEERIDIFLSWKLRNRKKGESKWERIN